MLTYSGCRKGYMGQLRLISNLIQAYAPRIPHTQCILIMPAYRIPHNRIPHARTQLPAHRITACTHTAPCHIPAYCIPAYAIPHIRIPHARTQLPAYRMWNTAYRIRMLRQLRLISGFFSPLISQEQARSTRGFFTILFNFYS